MQGATVSSARQRRGCSKNLIMVVTKKPVAKQKVESDVGGHIVKMRLPRTKLTGKDVEFVVKDGNDLVIGTLCISKGGLDWYPKNARVAR